MSRLDPGARLGADLVLLRLLGAGGIGEAWLARHRTRGTVVAKVLPSAASPDGPALLERECRLAMALDHPAIVPVFGCDRDGDWAWLIQAHVRGGDARQLRGKGAGTVLRAMLPVVDALEHAHARGVVHRDVKASNILLDQHGAGRLADFGLAATLPGGPEVAPLAGGGTRASMSPQQLEGAPPHPADDVYGLGALLGDLMHGSPLSPELAELLSSMVAPRQGDRPDLSAVREGLLCGLAALPAEPDRPARPRREVVLAPPPRIEAVISPAELSYDIGRAPSPITTGGRRSSALPVAVLGALMLAAVGVFVFLPRWVAGRAAASPAPAQHQAAVPASPAAPPAARAEARPAEADAAPLAQPDPHRPPRLSAPDARPQESAPAIGETEAAWSGAVSEGLRALDRGAFAEARAAFTRAESARRGTPEVADGLARADQGLRAEALAERRSQGEAAEAREDWARAVAEYGEALKLEPAVAFALAGRARSAARAELDGRLEGYVQRADRLTAEAVAREAEAAVARAREVQTPGPRLPRQIAAVEQLLAEFRAPVAVRLLSDGLTDVVVLRVGRFGTFREKALDLRPGTYVVVGTRRGYRDARHTLSVPRGKSPEPLLVRCDEAL